VAHHVFLNLEFVAAEIDQQSVIDPGGLKITQDLRDVLLRRGPARLQLHDQTALHQQIGEILANQSPVFVQDIERRLLFDLEAGLAQPVDQGVFINLLQVPVPVIDMNGISRFPHHVTEFIDCFHLLCSLRSFVADNSF
jgi:hypothetical protein